MRQMKTRKAVRNLLVWLLTLNMVFGLLPMAAFADEAESGVVDVDTPEATEEPAATEQPEEPQPEEPEATEQPADAEADGDTADEAEAQAEENVISENDILNLSVPELPTTADGSIRAVMLDCGRKYFSVDEIKNLIDTMVKYKYNQLQLSFGNGGCRFLLDDMSLKFKDGNGNTVTMDSDTVKTQISAGNNSFNGDSSYLTQSDMDAIIAYASGKVSIVPMLNMPGHATAIVYGTDYSSSGNLNVNNLAARNYGYALLSKYVEYFKDKCQYFSFGSDESGFTGDNMTSFVTGCAKIIANAGMRPRAFNDATNVATYPTYVQISYWHQENGSKTASALANAGYEMLNTHGRWYYVIKTAQNSEQGTKYWQGTVNSAATSVELPVMKAEKMDQKWVSLNEYFDGNPGYGSTISNSKGTMFCIWCDASKNDYLTGAQVLSYDENYGALYQLQKLAEHYWSNELVTPSPEPSATPEPTPTPIPSPSATPSPDADKLVEVNLMVGETSGTYTQDGDYSDAKTENDSIAVANVKVSDKEGTGKTVYEPAAIGAGTFYVSTKANDTNPTVQLTFESAGNGTYYIKNSAGEYIYPNASYGLHSYQLSWSYSLGSGKTAVQISGSADSGFVISNEVVHEGVLKTYTTTAYLTLSKTTFGSSGTKTNLYLYSRDDVPAKQETTLTFTGTGEGTTKAAIGGVEYTIKVTAPSTAKTVSLTHGSAYQLPANAEITVKSGNEYINVADGVITAGKTDGTAVVEAVVKNAGGYITERCTYTVIVSEIDFENVEPLPVELWVTNFTVGLEADEQAKFTTSTETRTSGSNSAEVITVEIAAKDAYKEEGVLLSTLLPQNCYKSDNSAIKAVYWKGTQLSEQPQPKGGDLSTEGSDFTYIRYWNDAWQYKNTAGEWVNLKTSDNNTVVGYYLQVNNVSPEITTGTQHYGDHPSSSDPGYSTYGFTMTTFAVVYPDGTLSRTELEMYKNGMLRGYYGGDSIGLGVVYAENNSDYVVSKMTLTWGETVTGNNDNNSWIIGSTNTDATYGDTWGVKWDKKTNAAGTEWYDETVYWENGNSDMPMIDGNTKDIQFTRTTVNENDKTKSNGKSAALILIYLEAVEKDENLNVVYWDDNANTQINTNSIQIVVKENVTFANGLINDGNVIGEKSSWPSNDKTSSDYLPDTAYITNSSGVNQTINKNITNMTGIAAKYRSGIYGYVSAEISEDGKTLTLHYDIKVTTKTFVVDFGLPVQGSLAGFGITDNDTVEQAGFNAIYADRFEDAYGSATMDDQYKVVYTLNKALDGKVILPLYVKFKGSDTAQVFTVTIIPASNVYYEDSFATFTGGKNTASAAQWSVEGTESKPNQALEQLGGENNNVYGYDPAYASSTEFSMGSAHKVTVSSAMLSEWNDDSAWPTASFTFKGTGFDVISLTDNKSGAIIVRVYKGNSTNGELYASYIVDNYYGYKQDSDGKWVVDTASTNCLYQIPVMQVRNLDYGEYTAEIVVFYNNAFDHTLENTSYSFWLDAIRVYNPLGENYTDYTNDGEGYPQYIKLRDYVVKNKDNLTDKVLFIDGADKADIATYENFGPNNEVYLANGQAISFKLPGNLTEIASVQIGAKAPNGETNLNVSGDNVVEKLNTATEMYYDITDAAKSGNVVTITNDGGNILSLTNIKVTFNNSASVELAAPSETDKSEAVSLVRALFAAPVVEPDPFEPSRFEAKWSDNVRQGGRAVLTVKTSEDVEQIVINGSVVVDSYRTRTERSGWGWNAKRGTYREFTYMITAQEGAEYAITAVNAEGVESEAITAVLTVKPARPSWGWFDDLFGRWF